MGTEAAHASNKLSEAGRRMALAEENEVELEVRPDGMRECNLLTFSFYAPWVKTTQLNARKREADDIRLKVRQPIRSSSFVQMVSNYGLRNLTCTQLVISIIPL